MSGSKTADPLDPENDLFWEGPEGIRKQQTTQTRVEPAPEPETAYRWDDWRTPSHRSDGQL